MLGRGSHQKRLGARCGGSHVAGAGHGRQHKARQEERVLPHASDRLDDVGFARPKTDAASGAGGNGGQGRTPGAGADHPDPLIRP